MAIDGSEQLQALRSSMQRGMVLGPVVIATGIVVQWLLPAVWVVAIGLGFVTIGIAGTFRINPHTVPTLRAQIASYCMAVGVVLLVQHLTLRWLSVLWMAAGAVILAKWPSVVRANPAARQARNLYFLNAMLIATMGIPLFIIELGMDWQRPVLSCLVLLPTAGWATLIGIVSVRLLSVAPVPKGVDVEAVQLQTAMIEQAFMNFLKPLPFTLSSIAVLGVVAGTMYYVDITVGAVVGSVMLLMSLEVIVRKRRVWSQRTNWLLLGVFVGSLMTLTLASSNFVVEHVVLLAMLMLVVDAVTAVLGRPMRWNLVPATSVFELGLFLVVPAASLTAAVVRLGETL